MTQKAERVQALMHLRDGGSTPQEITQVLTKIAEGQPNLSFSERILWMDFLMELGGLYINLKKGALPTK